MNVHLILFFFIPCLLSYESAVHVAPHGFVESGKYDFNYQDPDAHVSVTFVNHDSSDFLWVWSLYTCNATVDVFQVIGIFTESEITPGAFVRSVEFRMLKANVPVFMTRNSQNLRVMALLPQDCGDRDCDFHFHFQTTPPCQIDAHFHRGILLIFNEVVTIPTSVYTWDNATAGNQLFAVEAYNSDFPLTLTVSVSSNDWVELHHSWNLGGTIFRGLHRGSFSVAIPLRSEFESGSVMCFWIRTHDQSQYTVEIAKKQDNLLLTFYSNGFKVLLCILCGIIVVFMCYGRCRSREELETNIVPILFTDTELSKLTDTFKYSSKTKSDTRCSICLEDYENGVEMRKLPCNHDFHRSCIDTWLTNWQRKCPLCQQDIDGAEDYFCRPADQDFATHPAESLNEHPDEAIGGGVMYRGPSDLFSADEEPIPLHEEVSHANSHQSEWGSVAHLLNISSEEELDLDPIDGIPLSSASFPEDSILDDNEGNTKRSVSDPQGHGAFFTTEEVAQSKRQVPPISSRLSESAYE